MIIKYDIVNSLKFTVFQISLVLFCTLVGRISAMTVQAMAPKPIMKVKMMTMMERRGTQDQLVRSEN